MKKWLMMIAACLLTCQVLWSQQLMVKRSDRGLHLEHQVAAKEGFYSIGRIYNVHPKHLAAYNNLDLNGGLSIGQVLQVPLSDTNFNQKSGKGLPVYYTVGEKEGLMKVSNSHNKVSLQQLREWNKLSGDNINVGAHLIIGYLITNDPAAATAAVANQQATVKATEEKPAPNVDTTKATASTEEKKPEQTAQVEPKKEIETRKEEAKAVLSPSTGNSTGQGYFKTSFDQQVKAIPVSKTETVTSGIFKTNAGLQDAKYYLLIDNVPSGTIVRITNPDNNKAVYAKVLGEMSGIRQNQGFDIRMSNMAASTLGISETDKFIVKISY